MSFSSFSLILIDGKITFFDLILDCGFFNIWDCFAKLLFCIVYDPPGGVGIYSYDGLKNTPDVSA